MRSAARIRIALKRRDTDFALSGLPARASRIRRALPCAIICRPFRAAVARRAGVDDNSTLRVAGAAVFAAPSRFASLGVIHIRPSGSRERSYAIHKTP
jgi:hypothetical protein